MNTEWKRRRWSCRLDDARQYYVVMLVVGDRLATCWVDSDMPVIHNAVFERMERDIQR